MASCRCQRGHLTPLFTFAMYTATLYVAAVSGQNAALSDIACVNQTTSNFTGLLVSTSWLDAWITGPPAVDLQYPWGTTGTWEVASARTVGDLLHDADAGGNFSILWPAWVSTSYSNRTVLLYVYDFSAEHSEKLVSIFLNSTTQYTDNTSAPIVRVTAVTSASVKPITTKRFDIVCVKYGPELNNITSSKWLALQEASSVNTSDFNSDAPTSIANATESPPPQSPSSIITVENEYVFFGVLAVLLIGLCAGIAYACYVCRKNASPKPPPPQSSLSKANVITP